VVVHDVDDGGWWCNDGAAVRIALCISSKERLEVAINVARKRGFEL